MGVNFPQPVLAPGIAINRLGSTGPTAAGEMQLPCSLAGVEGQEAARAVGRAGCGPAEPESAFQLCMSHNCPESPFPHLSWGEDHSKNAFADIYGILTIPDALGH